MVLIGAIVLASPPLPGRADVQNVGAFLQQHCHDCHADGAAEGGLDLKRLGLDLGDRALFDRWERIHDRVGGLSGSGE